MLTIEDMFRQELNRFFFERITLSMTYFCILYTEFVFLNLMYQTIEVA